MRGFVARLPKKYERTIMGIRDPVMSPGEETILQSYGSRFGLNRIPGRLTLTNKRLIFQPNRSHIDVPPRDEVEVSIGEIVLVQSESLLGSLWSHLPGVRAWRVTRADGHSVSFQTADRRKWMDSIARSRVDPQIV